MTAIKVELQQRGNDWVAFLWGRSAPILRPVPGHRSVPARWPSEGSHRGATPTAWASGRGGANRKGDDAVSTNEPKSGADDLPTTCATCPAAKATAWRHGGRALVLCADDCDRVRIADATPPGMYAKYPCPRRRL